MERISEKCKKICYDSYAKLSFFAFRFSSSLGNFIFTILRNDSWLNRAELPNIDDLLSELTYGKPESLHHISNADIVGLFEYAIHDDHHDEDEDGFTEPQGEDNNHGLNEGFSKIKMACPLLRF